MYTQLHFFTGSHHLAANDEMNVILFSPPFLSMVQDALVDVVLGLGVPPEKLILNTPAFANSFNLQDAGKNLPGSATTGPPSSLTYQQVITYNHYDG